jgi:CRISPR/Cas system-associated endonuclease/helicase Cas3
MQWQSVNGKIIGTCYQMYSLRIMLTCVVVLDEAHKYLINSNTARLTQSILSIIRLQRHLATRIIIATQVCHHRPIVTCSPRSPHV